jgi:autotransporter-associated beta strand protein
MISAVRLHSTDKSFYQLGLNRIANLFYLLPLATAFVLVPAAGRAAVVSGKAKLTAEMAYCVATGKDEWVVRVDPQDVNSFQLDISFDSNRVSLDPNYGTGGVEYKGSFSELTRTVKGTDDLQLSGTTTTLEAGDVDILELHFIDNDPGTSITDVPFTISASGGGDFLGSLNTVTGGETITSGSNISPITLTSIPGVSPMVWDPDGVYNNGKSGGAGTWSTNATQWDNLPPVIVSDTNWNNSTDAHNIAIFGGNSGGTVNVSGQILVGGFQFDMPGYTLQSGTLELSAPQGYVPTIDTGDNDAAISSVLSGSGFQKLGTGTLALSGDNTFSGTTTISAGAVQISSDKNLGASTNPLVLDSGTLATTASMTLGSARTITLDKAGGTLDTAAGTFLSFGGAMSGPGILTKTGLGTLSMSGSSNFGGTVIDNGELYLTGILESSVTVDSGTFCGTGAVNEAVTVGNGGSTSGGWNAFLKPGSPGTIGTLSMQSLFLNTGALFQVDIDSSAPTKFDQLRLSGSSNLGNGVAALAVTDLGTADVPLDTIFTIVDNTSTQPTSGYFAGLPDGSLFYVGANEFQIDYDTGSSLNDIEIVAVPEPAASTMALAGFGLLYCCRRRRR